jgi:zinc protease
VALTEIRRIQEHGFSDEEVERALARFDAASEQRHQQRESVQDAQIMGAIVAHHLAEGPLMSPEQQFEVESRLREGLDRTVLESVFQELSSVPPVILAVGPDESPVPVEEEILETVARVSSSPVTVREDGRSDVMSLMAGPDAVPPVSTQVDTRFGYRTLVFDNGASVFLWRSDIAADGVYAAAESFGGTSLIDVEDLPEAFLMTEIIARSGIGPADVPTLQRLLASRLVQVFPWVSETREGLTASSASKDVETLFQMIHLYMTAPRFDDIALEAVVAEVAAVNESRADLPDLAVEEALIRAYYGDDPRYFAFPSPEQMADFDLAAAEEVYLERFGNAGDFAFAFVGDFDVDEMTEMASRYIGSLPGSGEREEFVDTQPLPSRQIQLEVVESGADPQGSLSMFFTNPHDPGPEDYVTASLLSLIVNARLRDKIREEMSATYSVFGRVDLQRDPDPFAESFVTATGAPEDLERISDAILEVLSDIRVQGPTDTEFATAVEQLRDEFDLIDNPTLADALLNAYLYPDEPVANLGNRAGLIEEISPDDVRRLAAIAYDPTQRIEIRLVPRS